ncbi:phospho-N-acetylmuramoyl-pentapeptide-transferase [Psittacicella melopsittaci]|uniref:Phospho-N-acetylmuramoyl-pentapeptide-transferase n=1 Tax=Psittacicella melopsittaci TaxID=2028576 RepID=A0A3A1Y411_9GAMM|nr:phospho-N-acetylmuramoyl-pentapeptide-transferase [Psittacicella melopsittaci]RIY32983.1 phospho-N-acetylmuramoyl-pentapeptide-transferase [Psittacicella melopsittaci]
MFIDFTSFGLALFGAFAVALIICLSLGPTLIKTLHKLKYGQSIRTDGMQTHLKKQGTPTMGGVMIILAVTVGTLLFSRWNNLYIWLALLIFIGFGLVGYIDDYLKIKRRNSDGLSVKQKYISLSLVSLIPILILYFSSNDPVTTSLAIPLVDWMPNIGFLFIPFAYFTVVGASNAVNLTDGLDGLAIIPTLFCALGFGFIAIDVGGFGVFSGYNIPQTLDLAILCAALVGACVGFFWFNSYPAQVFMGDVGSLALGGLLGFLAVLVRQELLLVIMGGVFVVECLSSAIQMVWFKYTKRKYGEGRRVFLMAPLHHHFEKKGLSETKVIARFWSVAFVLLVLSIVVYSNKLF